MLGDFKELEITKNSSSDGYWQYEESKFRRKIIVLGILTQENRFHEISKSEPVGIFLLLKSKV